MISCCGRRRSAFWALFCPWGRCRSYEGTKLGVTISAGVAERIADTDEPATTLYDRADAKLYEAKEAGRNCVKA